MILSWPCVKETSNYIVWLWSEGVLNARLEDGDVHRTVCSVPKCKLQLALTSVEKLLSRSQYDRFRELLAKRYADSNPGIRWYTSSTRFYTWANVVSVA